MADPPTDEEVNEYLRGPDSPEIRAAWMRRLLGEDDVLTPSPTGDVVFFGQASVKDQLAPFISSRKQFPDVLILGPSGIGKTHLARWIASQKMQPFEELLCPVKPEDLPHYGIILLDEAHKQRNPEWLFPVMERSNVSILAATTRPELLEGAFKSRFFLELRLVSYTEDALVEMCSYLLPGDSEEAAKVYAGASAGNPRQMEKLCAVAEEVGMESVEIVLDTVKLTADGVSEFQITLMESLFSANRPLGMTALETLLYSDEQSVREAERLLIENDLIELRTNGRTITKRGKRYLEELNAS